MCPQQVVYQRNSIKYMYRKTLLKNHKKVKGTKYNVLRILI